MKNMVPCIGKGCPLCAAGVKARPPLTMRDERTGDVYQVSPELSEKIYALIDKERQENGK